MTQLIGFCSLPFTDSEGFIKEVDENLFKKYRKTLTEFSGEDDGLYDGLYMPEFYYIWGKFDLCILSGIDDIEFATRFFGRYENPKPSFSEMNNFEYRVNLGVGPVVHTNFNQDVSLLPYIGITQIKLNSAFVVGNGLTFIELAKKELWKRIENIKFDENVFFSASIYESFSYHEIIIIIKSNSITALKGIILELRGLKISDMSEIQEKKVIHNSLFKSLQSDGIGEGSTIHNHLFESSMTSFGVRSTAFDSEGFVRIPPVEEEDFFFFSRWNIKPGHTKRVLHIIDEVSKAHKLNVELMESGHNYYGFEKFQVTGKGDIILKMKVEKGCPDQLNFPKMFFDNTDLHEHIRETYTSVGFEDGVEVSDYEKKDHHDIHGRLNALIFDKTRVDSLSANAKALWLPKPLTDKILRIVSSFNSAVLNPDMYVFYGELRAYIDQSIFQTVELYHRNKATEQHKTVHLIDKLEAACENIEIGFLNRYYQSYWTTEFPEINTNFSGGLHNMVTSYDACYKSLNSIFRDKDNQDVSFLNIISHSRVKSDYDVLAINILYLVHPYLFSSIALHEALNFSLDKYSRDFYENGDEEVKEGIRKVYNFIKEAKISMYLREYEKLLNKDLEPSQEVEDILRDVPAMDRNLTYKISRLVNDVCLRYLVTDYLNFQIGFDKNFDLFMKVRWDHFYQSSFVYNSPGKVNDTYFLTLTIRLALIKSITGNQALSIEDYNSIIPDWEILKSIKEKYAEDVSALMSSVYFIKGIGTWLKRLPQVLSGDNLEFLNKRWIDDRIVQTMENYLTGSIEVNEVCEMCINAVCQELPQDEHFAQCTKAENLTQASFNTIYVSILNAILKVYSSKASILVRKVNTGEAVIKEGGKFLLDPCGGIFVTGKKEREQYLNNRIRIYRLLFHIGQLHKKTYIESSELMTSN